MQLQVMATVVGSPTTLVRFLAVATINGYGGWVSEDGWFYGDGGGRVSDDGYDDLFFGFKQTDVDYVLHKCVVWKLDLMGC